MIGMAYQDLNNSGHYSVKKKEIEKKRSISGNIEELAGHGTINSQQENIAGKYTLNYSSNYSNFHLDAFR